MVILGVRAGVGSGLFQLVCVTVKNSDVYLNFCFLPVDESTGL